MAAGGNDGQSRKRRMRTNRLIKVIVGITCCLCVVLACLFYGFARQEIDPPAPSPDGPAYAFLIFMLAIITAYVLFLCSPPKR
jgi:hypothetical protein